MRFAVFILMLLSCVLKAQDNNFLSREISFSKEISLDKTPLGAIHFDYFYCNKSKEIAITFYNSKENKDTILFYILNTQTDSVSLDYYYVEGIAQSITNSYTSHFHGISLSKKNIAIITDEYVYILDRNTKQPTRKIKNGDLAFENVFFTDDENSIFYRNYNNIDKKKKTELSLFSITSSKFIKQTFPKFDCIKYTHLSPSHWVDYFGGKLLFSHTLNYRIALYDNKLAKTNTIVLPEQYNWKALDRKSQNKISNTKGAVKSITEMLKYENKINRIVGVYWLSDTAFVVNINKGIGVGDKVKYEVLFDVWKYRDKKWTLDKYHIIDQVTEDIKISNKEYSLFGGDKGRNYVFTNDAIYLLTFTAPISLKKYATTKEYITACNEYLFENDLLFQVIKFKHNLNE